MTNTGGTPAGWYHASGDPEGTQRYWDGGQWIGEPQASQPQPAPQQSVPPPPPGGQQPPSAPSYGQQAPSSYGQSAPPGAGGPPPGAPPGYVAYGQSATSTSNLASPGQRIGARAIDWVLWIIVSVVIGVVFGGASLVAGDDDDVGVVATLAAGLVSLAVITAYEVLMVANGGATLGKKLLNMKVVREDGSDADMQTALMRMSIYIGLAIVGLIPIIGLATGLINIIVAIVSLIFLFTDDRRQAVWDKVGKTIVVAT